MPFDEDDNSTIFDEERAEVIHGQGLDPQEEIMEVSTEPVASL
jgi:hypothetical protein